MKTLFICLLMVFVNFCLSLAQNSKTLVEFYGQGSSEGVKLLWFIQSWPNDLDGYNVKRKAPESFEWVKLNRALIIPNMGSDEDLNNVTNDENLVELLKEIQDSLIKSKKLPVLPFDSINKNFFKDEKMIGFYTLASTVNYNRSLLNDIAFFDKTIDKAGTYTFGLFPVYNGKEASDPVGEYVWEYGTEPDRSLEYIFELNKEGKKSLELTWKFSTAELKEKLIREFNVFMEDSLGNIQKLNDTPFRPNLAEEEAVVIYKTKGLDINKKITFTAEPIDAFDTKGTPLKIEYDPQKYPDLPPPRLNSNGRNGGIELFWEYDVTYNNFIEEFELTRRFGNQEERSITRLEANERDYLDGTLNRKGYYFYTLIIKTTFGGTLRSNTVSYFFQPTMVPPTPKNLSGTIKDNGNRSFVQLRWSPKSSGDSLTSGYYLFTDGVIDEGLAREGSIGFIQQNSFEYEIERVFGKEYRFAIKAVSEELFESEMSDTISVFVPSKKLPPINIWPVDKNDNIVTLNWEYPDFIEDLAGFRLFQNGELLETESDITSDTRQWVSQPLEQGEYAFQIEAVTSSGVSSKKSVNRRFRIE